MRRLNFLFFLSIILFIIGCKVKDNKIGRKNNTLSVVADTLRYSVDVKGNKLSGIITVQKRTGTKNFTADEVDNYLAGEFIFTAEKGALAKLKNTSGEKKYFDSYEVPVSTFRKLYDSKHDASVGLKFFFVELDKDYSLINVAPNYRNFLYMIAVPVNTDGVPVGNDNKYMIFNLTKGFDLNTSKVTDEEFDRLKKYYSKNNSEIYGALASYYSRENKGNTQSVFYSWGDIRKNINKFCETNKYDQIKFKLGEVIGINSIRYYIVKNPQLGLDEDKYELAYNGKEKLLTLIGEFYLTKDINGIKKSESSGKYFDMGSLYP